MDALGNFQMVNTFGGKQSIQTRDILNMCLSASVDMIEVIFCMM